jgi:hypothetical protein
MQPESFAIKCPTDHITNKLWHNYIDWFNAESEYNVGGNGTDYYYGINTSGKFDYSPFIEDFKVIKPLSYISEILNIEKGLKVGDWIKIVNKPIDGSVPPNWHSDMNKYFGTWQQVVNFVSGKPWVDGSWCIEHSNYTDIKTNEEYIRDVVSKSGLTPSVTKNFCGEIAMPKTNFENLKVGDWVLIKNYPDEPPNHWNSSGEMEYLYDTWQQVIKLTHYILIDCSKKSVSDVWSLRMDDVISYLTDEEYKKRFEPSATSDKDIISTTSKLIDWHNAQYDRIMLERQRIFEEDQKITESLLFSNPLTPSECYPATPDGWTPAGTFTKTAANLIATKPVKVTGYKYVNLKNK